MNTSEMQKIEKVFGTEKMKPLVAALFAEISANFKNKTPLAKAFLAIVDELASPNSNAYPSDLNIGERMMAAGFANTILGHPLVKGN